MPVRPSSPAQRNAVRKHDTEKVDKINVRLPKGSKELIHGMGYSVNSYVIDAVVEKLKRDGADISTLTPCKEEKAASKSLKSTDESDKI